MKTKENTKILFPNGEWRQSIRQMLDVAQIPYQEGSARSYELQMTTLGLTAVTVRASDIPRLINDPQTSAIAGITGEDIAIETGLQRLGEKSTGWPVPLKDINPEAVEPTVYLGSTPQARKKYGEQPSLRQLAQGTIVTAYPELARQYCEANNIGFARIEKYGGSLEGLYKILAQCYGIIDISSTGETMRANDITFVETIIGTVLLLLLRAEQKMNAIDVQRLEDFQSELLNAVEDQKIIKDRSYSWI